MGTLDSKTAILGRIRSSLANGEGEAVRKGRVDAWLSENRRGPMLKWHEDNTERFSQKLRGAGARLLHLQSLRDVPQAIALYLNEQQLQKHVWLSGQSEWASMDWADIERHRGEAQPDITVYVSKAFKGIAETGTLAMLSSSATPAALNFLCDHHIVVLRRQDMVRDLEAVWTEISRLSTLPRTVNLITGPSRTADIEQTIQIGAHGPKYLTVLLYS